MLDQAKLLKELLEGDLGRTRTFLKKLKPAEIAHLIETSLPQQRGLVWQLVQKELRGEVLLFLGEDVRQQLIETMDMDQLSAAFAELDHDDLADLLQELPDRILEEYLSGLESMDRNRLESLLSYPEDSAGGLMNPEIISVRPDTNMDVIKRLLRRKAPLNHLEFIYVTNSKNRLLGTLPITRLVYAEGETNAGDIMEKKNDTLDVNATAQEITRKFEDHGRVEIAVIDKNKTLLGRITFDDVFELVREQGEQQRVSFTGGDNAELDIYAGVRSSFFSRGLWLGINLATAFLAAAVIGLFEHTIQQVVALAVLMPVVASMGGIAGTQTLTIMVRGFARGQISRNNILWLLWRELRLGMINGLIWALVVGLIAAFWYQNFVIGLVIAVAMIFNLCLAGLMGVFLPVGLRAIRIDPAVSGGVILTTFTDVCGFITFLGLATLLFM